MLKMSSKRQKLVRPPAASSVARAPVAKRLFSIEIWDIVLSFLDIQECWRHRLVCRWFDQIAIRQFRKVQTLSLCIRTPVQLVLNQRNVRPFYREGKNRDTNLDQRSLGHADGLLVWFNEHKLIQRLSLLCAHLRTLRFYQSSHSVVYIDIGSLIHLANLNKLHLDGEFMLTNKSDRQLPQVQRLTFLSQGNKKLNLWAAFPNVISFQGFPCAFHNRWKPLGLTKLHFKRDCWTHFYFLLKNVTFLQNLEIVSFTFVDSYFKLLIGLLSHLKNVRKVNLNFFRLGLFDKVGKNIPSYNDYLTNRLSLIARYNFNPLLYSLIHELYDTLDVERIELRINGFLMTTDFHAAYGAVIQYLSEYPWNQKFAFGEDKLDCFLADKLRALELSHYPFTVENRMENFKIFARHLILTPILSLPLIDNVVRIGQHICQLTLDLKNPEGKRLNLQFLLQLPCLQRINIENLSSTHIDELCVGIIPKLPFLDYLCLTESFSKKISFQTAAGLFESFASKARRNLHMKYFFDDLINRRSLMQIKKLKQFKNVLLFNISSSFMPCL